MGVMGCMASLLRSGGDIRDARPVPPSDDGMDDITCSLRRLQRGVLQIVVLAPTWAPSASRA